MSRRVQRPAGYFQTSDANGTLIEGETRRCVHCGRQWQYVVGSGRHRGFCMKCNGILCGKKLCMEECIPFERRLEITEARGKLNLTSAEERALSNGAVLL